MAYIAAFKLHTYFQTTYISLKNASSFPSKAFEGISKPCYHFNRIDVLFMLKPRFPNEFRTSVLKSTISSETIPIPSKSVFAFTLKFSHFYLLHPHEASFFPHFTNLTCSGLSCEAITLFFAVWERKSTLRFHTLIA